MQRARTIPSARKQINYAFAEAHPNASVICSNSTSSTSTCRASCLVFRRPHDSQYNVTYRPACVTLNTQGLDNTTTKASCIVFNNSHIIHITWEASSDFQVLSLPGCALATQPIWVKISPALANYLPILLAFDLTERTEPQTEVPFFDFGATLSLSLSFFSLLS